VDLLGDVRRFNRHWTVVLGLLDEGLLETEYPLPEARVLFELAQQDVWERADLRARLDIDESFLTRLLQRLQRKGLVAPEPSPADGRRRRLRLTDAGLRAAEVLDRRAMAQVEDLLAPLDPAQRLGVVRAMRTIEQMTGPRGAALRRTLRGVEAGDLGWVVARHGVVYADEFGWDQDFEGLVARIVGDYQAERRPGREEAWVAELDGMPAGFVLCRERDEDTAQLRLLLVEPWARGAGLGRLLVDRCIEFATAAG
jgi:DNA-binding MarR family transcriptional regulator